MSLFISRVWTEIMFQKFPVFGGLFVSFIKFSSFVSLKSLSFTYREVQGFRQGPTNGEFCRCSFDFWGRNIRHSFMSSSVRQSSFRIKSQTRRSRSVYLCQLVDKMWKLLILLSSDCIRKTWLLSSNFWAAWILRLRAGPGKKGFMT